MQNRQIVLTRNTIVGVVGAIVGLLAVVGVGVSDALSDQIVDVLVVVLPLVLTLGAGLWTRLHVTPVFDPRDADGTPLVRQDVVTHQALVEQDEADAAVLSHLDAHFEG